MNQGTKQQSDIARGEEPKSDEADRLVLVYYKPLEVKYNGIAFALVHGTSTVEEVREAFRSTRIGREATYIDNDTGKDAKIKDIDQKTSFNLIKAKESCGEIKQCHIKREEKVPQDERGTKCQGSKRKIRLNQCP